MNPEIVFGWFIFIFAIILLSVDPIEINSDDFWVFNIVKDMVQNPSYFSLSGSGYRLMHKLIYLPVFLIYDFDVSNLAFPAFLITFLFDFLLLVFSYKLFKRVFNWRVATIGVFLLSISHAIIRNTWYWSSTHLNIATAFFVICLYFISSSDSKKSYLLSSVFCFLAIFTRETFVIVLFFIYLATLFFNRRYSGVKNYFIAFWPFILYLIYIFLNFKFIGTIVNPQFSGFINPSINNVVNFWDYFVYLFKTFLFLPIGFSVLLLFLQRKRYFTALKNFKFEHVLLFVWLVSGLIILLLTTNTDHRYLIPILPVTFAFIAKILDSYLFENNKSLFLVFEKVLLFNILFWMIIFSSSKIAQFTLLSYSSVSVILNVLFYALVLYAISSPFFSINKNSKLILKILASIIFVCFTMTSFVQLGMTYYFFVFQHNYTDSLNEAVAFIAKTTPKESYVIGNPSNPLTGFDKHWFEAFGRTDLQIMHVDTAVPLNHTDKAFYVGTPTSSMDTDIITPFVYANKRNFKIVAKFGSELQKYPSLRIPNSLNKAVSQFLSTKLLFRLEPLQGYTVFIFEKRV